MKSCSSITVFKNRCTRTSYTFLVCFTTSKPRNSEVKPRRCEFEFTRRCRSDLGGFTPRCRSVQLRVANSPNRVWLGNVQQRCKRLSTRSGSLYKTAQGCDVTNDVRRTGFACSLLVQRGVQASSTPSCTLPQSKPENGLVEFASRSAK